MVVEVHKTAQGTESVDQFAEEHDVSQTLSEDSIRALLSFPTEYAPELPITIPLSPTLSPTRIEVNRVFFPQVVQIRRERREVLGWERTVQLENGRVRRQDEVLDGLDRLESTLLTLRTQILTRLSA